MKPLHKHHKHTHSPLPSFEALAGIKPQGWNNAQFRVLYQGFKARVAPEPLLKKLEAMGYRASMQEVTSFFDRMAEFTHADPTSLTLIKQQNISDSTHPKIHKLHHSAAARKRVRHKSPEDSHKTTTKTEEPKRQATGNMYPSKRKVRPQEPSQNFEMYDEEERLQEMENIFSNCISNAEEIKRITKRHSSSCSKITTSTWIERQFFYPNLDRPFFEQNNFVKLVGGVIKQLHSEDDKIRFYDFKLIQESVGRVGLLSAEIMIKEREALEYYRQLGRSYIKTRNSRIFDEFCDKSVQESFDKLTAPAVGRAVLAVHPICGHLHQGSVLAIFKENQIIIKFTKPELGVRRVQDFSICSEFKYLYRKAVNIRTLDVSILSNMDFTLTSLQFKLLETKSSLLAQLRLFNKELERMKSLRQEASEDHRQVYGYTCFMIEIIDRLLSVLFRRVRLLCNYTKKEALNTMTVGGGNFISMIERELQIADTNKEEIHEAGLRMIKQEEAIDTLVGEVWDKANPVGEYFGEERLLKAVLSLLLCVRLFHDTLVDISELKYLGIITEAIERLKRPPEGIFKLLIEIYSK